MPRGNTQYDPGAEALRTTATPSVQTEQAATDPRRSGAFRLAEALGASSVQQGLDKLDEQMKEEQRAQARKFVGSQTLDQLGKAVKDGKLLPSQSPVYVATVQHMYGESFINKLQNDTVSEMNRGELSFESPEHLDSYLTGKRNEFLGGQSDYTVKGFDKKFHAVKEQLLDANTKMLDSRFVEQAGQKANESFGIMLDGIRNNKVPPAEAAKQLLDRYSLLSDTKVLLNPEMQRGALKSIVEAVAKSGNMELLAELKGTKLPKNGPLISAVVGDAGQWMLHEKTAEGVYDAEQRIATDNGLLDYRRAANAGELDKEKFRKYVTPLEKYIGSATIASIEAHNDSVIAQRAGQLEKMTAKLQLAQERDSAVKNGMALIAAGRPLQDVELSDGKTFRAQDIGEMAMEKVIGSNPEMSPQELVRRYALSGVKNKQWEREFGTATFNLGEVSIDANGKPTGELMPATLEALDKFATVRNISDAYARDLAGGERNYETLSHIQALREAGVPDVHLAASLVNQKNRRNLSPTVWGNIQTSVTSAMSDISNPGVMTGRFWGEVFRGEFGNGEKNTLPIQNSVKRLAETYLAAGVAQSGEQAVQLAGSYFARPEISTQINNTIYMNKDLPELPQGMDRTEWFEKAMTGFVGAKLTSMGIDFNKSDLTLIPQDGGNQPYMVSLRGQPVGVMVTKTEIKNWITTQADIERDQKITDANTARAKAKLTSAPANSKLMYPPAAPKGQPSIYAGPDEWARYREEQKRK